MTCVQHEGGEAQAGEDVVDEKSVEVEEGRVVAWCAGGIGVEGQHKGNGGSSSIGSSSSFP